MLTIYTPEITNRIKFIMNVIFKEHLSITYQLTDSISEFNNAKIKISYAVHPISDEIFIWQHSLLKEDQIKEQTIDIDSFENETIFFQSPVKESLLPFDIFSFSFFLLSRYEEYLPHKKDKHQRFPGTESIAYKYGFLQKPLVDIHILKFAQKLHELFPSLKFETSSTKYLATYDIDNAYAYKHKGMTRTLGGILRPLLHLDIKELKNRMGVLLNIRIDPFDTYQYIQTLQHQYNLKTRYFILFGEKSEHDRGLNPKNKYFRQLIKQLDSKGEVGIHPSYVSASNKGLLKKEITGLSSLLEKKITFCRSHFLLLNLPGTYQNFIANGIDEDFTLGYADQAGFRASTCKPFNFFDLSENKETGLKLYPLTYMEGSIQGYMNLPEKEGLALIKQLMDSVKSVDGTFISLWHNETLGKKSWKQWQKVYEESLEYFFTNF